MVYIFEDNEKEEDESYISEKRKIKDERVYHSHIILQMRFIVLGILLLF